MHQNSLIIKFPDKIIHRAIAKGDQIHLSVVEKPTVELYKKFDFSVSIKLDHLIAQCPWH